LEEAGLSNLNQRLIESGRKIWDTFVEHNFAAELISIHSTDLALEYEPTDGYERPPDFVIKLDNVTYFVQIKSLASLERENRQRKIGDKIKLLAKKIEIPKFFGIEFSTDFTEQDITELANFIANKAQGAVENVKYEFCVGDIMKARVDYWQPEKLELSHLTLGIAGDMGVVEETGLAEAQIRQSLRNAAGAFAWDADMEHINIIAMDANRHIDIDICDALFGTEYEIVSTDPEKKPGWSREDDGFYRIEEFRTKVVGVIALRSKSEYSPITSYSKLLYINPAFSDLHDSIVKLVPVDKFIEYNMRPPMGKGHFEIN
jgi:hypothetical protein